MVQYIFTPWRNRRELLAVRTHFYPQHHHQPPTQSRHHPHNDNYNHNHNHAPPSFPASYTSTDGGIELEPETTGRQQQQQQRWQTERKRKRNGPEDAAAADDDDDEREDGEDEEHKQKAFAVARVSMWMQRGGCPHMVESTALLMAAILSEGGAGRGRGSGRGDGAERAARGYAVRAAYSAAFSRFVTGLLDSHQDKQRKMSMYDVAKAVGLPATFVELRHQATHEQLPSLTRLRAAARKALEWIWEYYWRHLEGGQEQVDGSGVGDAGMGTAAEEGEREIGGGVASQGEREVRGLVERYLEREEGEDEELKGEIMGKSDGGLVLSVLDTISGTTRDSKVLRRALALTREVLEGREQRERMEEDEKAGEVRVAKDVERIKAELGEAWADVEEVEGTGMAESDDGQVEVEMAEERPAWVLYEENAWVPKPIGVV